VRFLFTVRNTNRPAVEDVVWGGLPAGLGASLTVVGDRLRQEREREVRHADPQVVPGGKLRCVLAIAQDVAARIGLLHRTRPDRDRAILIVASLPTKRHALRPGPENQFHTFQRQLTALRRIDRVDLEFIGGTAEKADDETAVTEGVERGEVFGHLDGIVQG
jgi:hypothetical protein